MRPKNILKKPRDAKHSIVQSKTGLWSGAGHCHKDKAEQDRNLERVRSETRTAHGKTGVSTRTGHCDKGQS